MRRIAVIAAIAVVALVAVLLTVSLNSNKAGNAQGPV
jgi:hypothetical protein